MEIDSRLLRYFVAVAEELSFSRAAARLHLSQPPLSYAIRQLEDNLGVRLLQRTSRHVELTPAGRALYKEARFLLQRSEDARHLVRRVDAGLEGEIKIGFVGSMLYRGLPALIRQCEQRFPDVACSLLELNSAEQIEWIERGGLDIGLIHANPVPKAVVAETLMVEPFVLCVPQGHPLAGPSPVTLSGTSGDDFIFFARTFSPVYHEILLRLCLDAGFMPQVRYEARHWLGAVSLVAQGMGVSIVPRSLRHCGMAGVVFLDFEHSLRTETQLIWPRRGGVPIAANHLALIREWFAASAADARLETSA